MHLHRRVFVIIQPRAAHMLVVERKPQRSNQMQTRTGIRTQADDIAGVGRDFGFVQDHVKHEENTQKACQYREKRLTSIPINLGLKSHKGELWRVRRKSA